MREREGVRDRWKERGGGWKEMRQEVREGKQMWLGWRANVKMRYGKEFEPQTEKYKRQLFG